MNSDVSHTGECIHLYVRTCVRIIFREQNKAIILAMFNQDCRHLSTRPRALVLRTPFFCLLSLVSCLLPLASPCTLYTACFLTMTLRLLHRHLASLPVHPRPDLWWPTYRPYQVRAIFVHTRRTKTKTKTSHLHNCHVSPFPIFPPYISSFQQYLDTFIIHKYWERGGE